MTESDPLEVDVYWSMRSPYSYLLLNRLVWLNSNYNVNVNIRPALPVAIRSTKGGSGKAESMARTGHGGVPLMVYQDEPFAAGVITLLTGCSFVQMGIRYPSRGDIAFTVILISAVVAGHLSNLLTNHIPCGKPAATICEAKNQTSNFIIRTLLIFCLWPSTEISDFISLTSAVRQLAEPG